jgi:hypothetical protein
MLLPGREDFGISHFGKASSVVLSALIFEYACANIATALTTLAESLGDATTLHRKLSVPALPLDSSLYFSLTYDWPRMAWLSKVARSRRIELKLMPLD